MIAEQSYKAFLITHNCIAHEIKSFGDVVSQKLSISKHNMALNYILSIKTGSCYFVYNLVYLWPRLRVERGKSPLPMVMKCVHPVAKQRRQRWRRFGCGWSRWGRCEGGKISQSTKGNAWLWGRGWCQRQVRIWSVYSFFCKCLMKRIAFFFCIISDDTGCSVAPLHTICI